MILRYAVRLWRDPLYYLLFRFTSMECPHSIHSGNVKLQFNTVKGGNLIKVQVFVKINPLFHTLKAAHYYVSRNKQTQSTTAVCIHERLVFTINIIPLLWNVVIPHHV